jgi:hypothetical protein
MLLHWCALKATAILTIFAIFAGCYFFFCCILFVTVVSTPHTIWAVIVSATFTQLLHYCYTTATATYHDMSSA